MAQIKLKAGDLVRIYRKDRSSRWDVGWVAVVTHNRDATLLVWLKDHKGVTNWLLKSCIAHVKYGQWITWKGGECPIGNGTPTQVRFRNGCSSATLDYPESLRWAHKDNHGDIVGFRIMKDWK